MTIKLALDAMGGDGSPDIVVEGASLALRHLSQGVGAHRFGGVHFNLYGDEAILKALVSQYPNLLDCSQIHHTEDVVANDTKPSVAVRMRRSSMRRAIESVLEGNSQAVVSAGNTGAYMALCKILLKTLDGIDRPAIAATIPNSLGTTVALDLGANVDCTVENLVQFAVMGDVVARRILHKKDPTLGLLNVGTEEMKGSAIVQQAAQILRDVGSLNYVGFVEGDDITSGDVDIVVTDGFTGNVALKTIEGVSHFIMGNVREAMVSSWRGKLAYAVGQPVFRLLKARMDPRLYNGAVFIGLREVAVKSHGGADGFAFANAIRVALNLAQRVESHNLAQEIEEKLKGYS